MDIWPGSHVQHVKPKQQTNKCQCQCPHAVTFAYSKVIGDTQTGLHENPIGMHQSLY
jgi:hypothetical protein